MLQLVILFIHMKITLSLTHRLTPQMMQNVKVFYLHILKSKIMKASLSLPATDKPQLVALIPAILYLFSLEEQGIPNQVLIIKYLLLIYVPCYS